MADFTISFLCKPQQLSHFQRFLITKGQKTFRVLISLQRKLIRVAFVQISNDSIVLQFPLKLLAIKIPMHLQLKGGGVFSGKENLMKT